MAFTEFCCRSGGSNLNAGAVDGSSTEPATSPLVTYTGGDWNATTDVYTAPVGADMTEAVVGRFAALYHDGDTVPTTNQFLIGRITAVNAGSRTITIPTTARMNLGTEVATGTGNRSLRIGGAWQGPNGAVGFPFTANVDTLEDASGNEVRVNFKNDADYSITAAITNAIGNSIVAGYTSSYGDGGKAVLKTPNNAASFVLLTATQDGFSVHDFIFKENGNSGAAAGVSFGPSFGRGYMYRCVVHSVRGNGFLSSGQGGRFIECEAYNCNLSSSANTGGFSYGGSGTYLTCVRCISHDNTGHGFGGASGQANSVQLLYCITDSNTSHGVNAASDNGHTILNCDFYNNGGSGILLNGISAGLSYIENCNFIKNGGWGINRQSVVSPMLIQSCGFGAGTQANTSGTISSSNGLIENNTVTYTADVTPWVDPVNGDFRINLAAAKNAGRGAFSQTASSYAGTVGYPDIGAAQHQDSGGSGGIKRGGGYRRRSVA